jgi:hypothetical protein
MSGYTVTITPAGGQGGPQTTIHVDTTTGAARVTELTMTAADGNGLAPQQLPVFDLAGLVAALAPGTTPAITSTAVVAEAPVARSTTRSRRSRGAAAKTEKAGPKKSVATRGRRRGAAAGGEEPKAGRAYRRMPEQDDVVAAWQQSGSASAVAEHFGVPRHTATGWLRRLRSLGVIEGKS